MNPNQKLTKTQTLEDWASLARAVMLLLATSDLNLYNAESVEKIKYLTNYFSDINQEIIDIAFSEK